MGRLQPLDRHLNAVTKTDQFPLPWIDDCLNMLSEMKYFNTLDLASGYCCNSKLTLCTYEYNLIKWCT